MTVEPVCPACAAIHYFHGNRSTVASEPLEPEVEQVWEDFWLPIVARDGVIDMDQVKRELHDCHLFITEVPKVYMHVTNGRISKPNTAAFEVIGQHDELYADRGDHDRMYEALERAADEGRNVLPDATDDQAATIEAWALAALDWERT